MPSPPLQHDAEALSKVIACAELQIPLIYAPAPLRRARLRRGRSPRPCWWPTPRCSAVWCCTSTCAPVLAVRLRRRRRRHGHAHHERRPVHAAGGRASRCRPAATWRATTDCRASRTPANSESKILDEQWSAEAALTTMLGGLSRATLLHDVGYLEDGMQSSYESIVLGDELAGYARAFMREVPVDEYSLALDEIARRRTGRQSSEHEVHAPALPRVLDQRAVRRHRLRPLDGRGRAVPAGPGARQGRAPARRAARVRARARAGGRAGRHRGGGADGRLARVTVEPPGRGRGGLAPDGRLAPDGWLSRLTAGCSRGGCSGAAGAPDAASGVASRSGG